MVSSGILTSQPHRITSGQKQISKTPTAKYDNSNKIHQQDAWCEVSCAAVHNCGRRYTTTGRGTQLQEEAHTCRKRYTTARRSTQSWKEAHNHGMKYTTTGRCIQLRKEVHNYRRKYTTLGGGTRREEVHLLREVHFREEVRR